MSEHSVKLGTPPEKIGDIVMTDFKNGETYVLVHGAELYKERSSTTYNNLHEEHQESGDTQPYYKGFEEKPQHTRHYLRHKAMLTICERFAQLDTFYSEIGDSEYIDPLRGLEVIGRRGEPLKSDNATTFHTEEASDPYPSRIVSYWDAQPAGENKGEKIHLLSVNDILKWTTESPDNRAFLATLREPQEFKHKGRFKAPIYDQKAQTIRYHEIFKGSTVSLPKLPYSEPIPPTKVEAFFQKAFEEELGETVQMQPGSILFIDNHKTAHAVQFEANKRRMTYKLLLTALNAEIVAAQIKKQQNLKEAS